MEKIKLALVYSFSFTVMLYAFIYFIAVFVRWEFFNPVQCIIDLPTYDSSDRFCIIVLYLFYQVFVFTTSYETAEEELNPKPPTT